MTGLEIVLTLLAAGLLAVVLYLALRANPLRAQLEQVGGEAASARALNASLATDRDHLNRVLAEERARQAELAAKIDELQRGNVALAGDGQRFLAERNSFQEQLHSQRKWVEEQTQHFKDKVLAAASTVMEERSRAASEQNRKDVDAVIAPFKEQLRTFRERVDQIHSTEAQERGSLKAQIEQLTGMNQAMSVQAQRLVNALTVTSKSTGDWGETILEKILEESGLRRGHEYELQVNITKDDGKKQIPDAVIYLPESRQLVIDSKVSNKAWTEFCAAQEGADKDERMKEHLASLRGHIRNLSDQRYNDSPDLKTVDFVLMFVPVEAALLTAFVKDPALYMDAYRARIVLVTPSTLMAVVKLIEGIWNFQKRKESAEEIADTGRKLYDKLANFAESMLEVGRAIDQSGKAFEKARGQLSTGRGNALALAESLKELGVTPSAGKQIPRTLLDLDDTPS